MIVKVMGKITNTHWSVEDNYIEKRDDDDKVKRNFYGRPKIKKEVVTIGREEICQYEGLPQIPYNSSTFIAGEPVKVEDIEFHADLGEFRQFVDKVVINRDYDKEIAEAKLKDLLKEYNSYVINGDERLLSYCKLHKLNIEDTDADELKKVVLGENNQVFTLKYSDICVTNNWATAVINNKLECCCT